MSVFQREEARAIVAYLEYKRDSDVYEVHTEQINAALELFWLDRAENAPTAEKLKQHVKEEQEYLAAIKVDGGLEPVE